MWFIDTNRRLSKRAASLFPHTKNTVLQNYSATVGGFAGEGRVIVDVGGGAQCGFAKDCRGSYIIAVDISASELQKNRDVADRRVADVTKQIPLPDNSADIVASRFMIEHLRGVERFVEEAARVLKPGGVFITIFPNKYAPFSLINRILPMSFARRVAYSVREGADRYGVFPAYYECCSHRAYRKLIKKHGFGSVDVKVSYDQSYYFHFFLPLALLSLCYESIISRFELLSLAAHVQIVATKGDLSDRRQ